jgi:hypothetical protein
MSRQDNSRSAAPSPGSHQDVETKRAQVRELKDTVGLASERIDRLMVVRRRQLAAARSRQYGT